MRCGGAAIAVRGGTSSVSPNSSRGLQGQWRGISSTGRGESFPYRVSVLSVLVVMRCLRWGLLDNTNSAVFFVQSIATAGAVQQTTGK